MTGRLEWKVCGNDLINATYLNSVSEVLGHGSMVRLTLGVTQRRSDELSPLRKKFDPTGKQHFRAPFFDFLSLVGDNI